MGRIIDKYFKSDIRTKINVFYIFILLLSLSISYVVYNTLTSRIVESEIGAKTMQTLDAIDKNLEFILTDVEQFSNLFFFDRTVQNALRGINSENVDPMTQVTFNKYLSNMISSGNYISSVYLFDNYSNRYTMSRIGIQSLAADRIEDIPIYKDIVALDGGLMWVVKGGGILLEGTSNRDYISLVRVINDTNTMSKLGTLIVNVDAGTIQAEFEDVGKKYNSQFFIMDSAGDFITQPEEESKAYVRQLVPLFKGEQGYTIAKINGSKVILSFISSKYSNWKIVGMTPFNEVYGGMKVMTYMIIVIVLLNCIFFTLSAFYISRLITQPLVKMQHHMKSVEQGRFVPVPADGGRREDEITQLKRVFNRMVGEIDKLINRVKEEERIKRKNELNLIQAQINPHFLYNTLDALSALTLIGDNKNAYKITQSLGSFYRSSLSSGREIITVAEEIACIKDYLAILDIRYNGKYDVEYDIAEEVMGCKVLKLILQPVVENAVHHGLRKKEGRGKLIIQGYRDGCDLVLKVKDDGVGMPEETAGEALNRRASTRNHGFGLYSSKQRISIFYNVSEPLRIDSIPGQGTEVTIRIPIVEEDCNVC